MLRSLAQTTLGFAFVLSTVGALAGCAVQASDDDASSSDALRRKKSGEVVRRCAAGGTFEALAETDASDVSTKERRRIAEALRGNPGFTRVLDRLTSEGYVIVAGRYGNHVAPANGVIPADFGALDEDRPSTTFLGQEVTADGQLGIDFFDDAIQLGVTLRGGGVGFDLRIGRLSCEP